MKTLNAIFDLCDFPNFSCLQKFVKMNGKILNSESIDFFTKVEKKKSDIVDCK